MAAAQCSEGLGPGSKSQSPASPLLTRPAIRGPRPWEQVPESCQPASYPPRDPRASALGAGPRVLPARFLPAPRSEGLGPGSRSQSPASPLLTCPAIRGPRPWEQVPESCQPASYPPCDLRRWLSRSVSRFAHL
ncbi:uncharacterized protein LOC126068488 isoform X1 [Elephas maximus indicus]|uniref:uncharacterized protein LOC126068488 isoform X1 n=1 Tax=Elephas maximus indicus TaxID=99487 RepID=UPI0021172B2A|nr:uncharacterized protein LOC126068488 isoform X1 [Elephas maximus indicus]